MIYKYLKKYFKKYFKKTNGQALVEYAFVLAFVIFLAVILTNNPTFENALQELYENITIGIFDIIDSFG